MNEIYTYSLLQYRHSQILGEVLNIGVLIYFKNKNKLRFLYPERLIRLKFAYPNVPERTIKAYFKTFEERVSELNNQPELFSQYPLDISLDKFISKELIPADSSALQFSETKRAISYVDDIDQISDRVFNLYFSVFDHTINTIRRIDETVLLKRYKSLLEEFDHDVFNIKGNIKFDYEIKPTSDSKPFKFEIAWKENDNITTNLVKPISFDVIREETIRHKAYRFYGQFLDLDDFAIKNHYKFDLLLAKPKNKFLFKTYDYAIKLLEKPLSVNLIEESKLKEYSKETINNLSLF